MKLPQTFDATQFDPQGVGNQLPVSDSKGPVVMIKDSTIKPTKNQDCGMVVLTLTIQEGPHAGESGDYRLNLFHTNPQTVEIAQRQLSALCHVTGVLRLDATEQLHGIPFRAIVGKQKPTKNEQTGQMEESNFTEVKGVLDVHGNDARKAQPPVSNNSAAAPGAAGTNAPPPSFHEEQSAPDSTPAPAAEQSAAAPAWGQNNASDGNSAPPWAK